MARAPTRRLFASGRRFDPQKHPRAQGGRFANKPGAGDDAPQGGKAHDVTADDVMTYTSVRSQALMYSRRGEAGVRFRTHYRQGATVDEMIQSATGAGISRSQVLSDLTWMHKGGHVRFDDQSLFSQRVPLASGSSMMTAVRTPLAGSLPRPGQQPGTPAAPGAQSTRPVSSGPVSDAEALADPQRTAWIAAGNAAYDARGGAPGDVGLQGYMRARGTYTSEVLDRAQFDQVRGTVILRGITQSSQVASQYDQQNFIGVGIYGNGQYYGGPKAHGVPFGYTQGVPPGHVWVSKLRADAHVVDHDVVVREQSRFLSSSAASGLTTGQRAYLQDVGRYAGWRGYDAIHEKSNDYFVVVNKSAVVVSRESLPGQAYDVQASASQPPDPQLVADLDDAKKTYVSYVQQMATQAQAGTVMNPTQIRTLQTHITNVTQYTAMVEKSAQGRRIVNLATVYNRQYGLSINTRNL